MGAAKKKFHFLYWTKSLPTGIQSLGFTNEYKFYINKIYIRSRHSTRNYILKFCKIRKAKKSIRWANYVY